MRGLVLALVAAWPLGAAAQSPNVPRERIGAWSFWSTRDPIDDHENWFAQTHATNSSGLVLYMSCDRAGSSLIATSDRLRVADRFNVDLDVRIGTTPARRQRWSTLRNGTMVLLGGPEAVGLFRQLENRLVIRISGVDGTVDGIFDTTGAAAVAARLDPLCLWQNYAPSR